MRDQPTVKLLEVVAEHQAVVHTAGTTTGEVGAAGEEERFLGIADYGGAAGANIKILTAGEVPFIAGGNLAITDHNKPLKLAASGRLALAEDGDAYVARYRAKTDHNTAGALSAGEHGCCFLERGVV